MTSSSAARLGQHDVGERMGNSTEKAQGQKNTQRVANKAHEYLQKQIKPAIGPFARTFGAINLKAQEKTGGPRAGSDAAVREAICAAGVACST